MKTSRTLTHFLAQRLSLILIPLTALLLSGTPAFALTLDVVGVELQGASGVLVDGTLYDVQFMDGTCIALFNGCDAVSDFTFQTQATALQAADALLNGVFVDGTSGQFDTSPELTAGCTSTIACITLTPYGLSVFLVLGTDAENFTPAGIDGSFPDQIPNSFDTSGDDEFVYALWSTSAQQPIPEPTTLLLLSSGLLGLASYRWRQGRREGQQVG